MSDEASQRVKFGGDVPSPRARRPHDLQHAEHGGQPIVWRERFNSPLNDAHHSLLTLLQLHRYYFASMG